MDVPCKAFSVAGKSNRCACTFQAFCTKARGVSPAEQKQFRP